MRSSAAASIDRHRTAVELAFLVAFVGAFHALSVDLVRNFYAINIPHYDSVGSLSVGYRILNAYADGGFSGAIAAISEDRASFALSMTQAGFAVLFAPVLERSPQSFQLYNTMAVALALAALYAFARGQRFGFGTAVAFSFIFFLPDGLWWWDFGLLDYRRDPAMFAFLTAAFFFLLAGYLGDVSPRTRGFLFVLCGLASGMTLLSRDSAPLFVIGTVLVPAAVLFALDMRRHGARSAIGAVLPAVLAGLPFAVVLAANAGIVMARLADPLIGFGGGGNRRFALKANAPLVLELTRGTWRQISYHSPGSSVTVFGWLAAGLAGLAWLRVFRHAEPSAQGTGRVSHVTVVLLASGVWCIVWVHLFLSLYVGWRPELPFTALAPPYLPALIGVYAIGAAFMGRFEMAGGLLARTALVLALAAGVLASMQLRIAARTYDTPKVMVDGNLDVGQLTRPDGKRVQIAELWFDTLKVPMIDNYALQRGQRGPARLRFGERWLYDTAIASPRDPAARDALLAALERAIRCDADYVIATTDLSQYARSGEALMIFEHGRPLAERLLADLKVVRGPYVVSGTPDVVVLDNTARATCR